MNESADIAFEPTREPLLRRSGLDAPPAFLVNRLAVRIGGAGGSVLTMLPLLEEDWSLFVARRPVSDDAVARYLASRTRALSRAPGGQAGPLLPPVAWGRGESGSGRPVFFSAALAPRDAMPLDRLLRAQAQGRRDVLERLAGLGAELHAAGRNMPGLCSWCVLALPGGKLVVADPLLVLEGSVRGSGAAADLAGLTATLEASLLPRSERMRLLRAYAQAAGLSGKRRALRRAWKSLAGAERGLRRRGFFPETFDVDDFAEEGGRGQITRAERPVLESLGFRSLRDFIDPPAGRARLLRDTGERRNYMIAGDAGRYFLKVHHASQPGGRESPGLREWRNNLRLIRCGLPTAPLAAWGERRGRSFFMSRDLGGVPADDALRDEGAGWSLGRRDLIVSLGRLVRAFHREDFFHRDLYLCHILLRESEVAFIDLQRMEDGYLFKRRGRVKDLAALYYSSLDTPSTRIDRLRFLKTYLGRHGPLVSADRSLASAVSRKARRIAAHAAGKDLRRGGGKAGSP